MSLSRDTFRSLGNRNYRLYWIGQAVSMTGTWLQFIAQALLVLSLTDSGVALGFLTACQFVPVLFVGGWAGLLADRVDKRRLMFITQTAMMMCALVLAGLVFSGQVEVWHVFALAGLTGLAGAFDQPARRTLVTELVNDDDLPNAVGLSSAVFTGSRIVGPALAGLLVATVGLGWCFLINGVSFLGVIVGLARMRTSELRPSVRVPKARGQIREGIRYVWANPPLRVAMALLAVVALLGFNWQVLVPLLATRTFEGTATTYTLITSMMSVGSLTGSLRLARRRDVSLRFVVLSCLAFGGASLLFAASPTVLVAIVTGALAGNLGITFMAGIQTFIQMEAVPEMRGRAMALFTILFMGTTPFGGPIVGWIAEEFGTRIALGIGGVVAGLGAVAALAWMRRAGSEDSDVPVTGREPALEVA